MVNRMGQTETVSSKVPAEHKRILQEHRVNISRLIQEAVEREVQRIEDEKLRKALAEASRSLQNIPDEHIIDSIRRSRDTR